MISSSELARISELGRVAGAVNLAQASECPYSHNTPDERFAWLAVSALVGQKRRSFSMKAPSFHARSARQYANDTVRK